MAAAHPALLQGGGIHSADGDGGGGGASVSGSMARTGKVPAPAGEAEAVHDRLHVSACGVTQC